MNGLLKLNSLYREGLTFIQLKEKEAFKLALEWYFKSKILASTHSTNTGFFCIKLHLNKSIPSSYGYDAHVCKSRLSQKHPFNPKRSPFNLEAPQWDLTLQAQNHDLNNLIHTPCKNIERTQRAILARVKQLFF